MTVDERNVFNKVFADSAAQANELESFDVSGGWCLGRSGAILVTP